MCVQLPNGWLWDMIDEFVYQFQSWQQYVGKLSTKGAEEIEALRSCERVWSVLSVLNYLQALVDHSGIMKELSIPGKHRHPCCRTLGQGHCPSLCAGD
jgi:translation initiation factor 3 subunit L